MDVVAKYLDYKNSKIFFTLFVIIYAISFSGYTHKVNVDEPWESVTSWQLIEVGKLNNPVLENRDYYDIHLLEPRIFQSIILAPVYALFGLDLWVGRLVSIGFGLVALFVFSLLLKNTYSNQKLIFLGVSLLLVHNLFYVYSRMIRPEVIQTFQVLLCYYLINRGLTEKSNQKLFLSGIVAGLGLLNHPNFLLFCVAFFTLILIDQKKNAFTQKLTISFVIGSLTGFLPFVIYLINIINMLIIQYHIIGCLNIAMQMIQVLGL